MVAVENTAVAFLVASLLTLIWFRNIWAILKPSGISAVRWSPWTLVVAVDAGDAGRRWSPDTLVAVDAALDAALNAAWDT